MKLRCLIILTLLLPLSIVSQDIILNGSTPDATQCSGNFLDQGSYAGNYTNNSFFDVSICSGSATQGVTLDFSSFNLENTYDYLFIYDGPDNTYPQVPGSPGTGNLGAFQVQSTGSCLFIEFDSDGSITASGWEAAISCYSLLSSICLLDYDFTVSPDPTDDVCDGDATYTFCVTITDWNGLSPDALHGFAINPAAAWDLNSISSVSSAMSCDGNGVWGFYTAVMGTGTGQIEGPGFFYESDAGSGLDADPGNNPGDQCSGPWEFCWQMTMLPCTDINDGDDATVTINVFSDGETGMFNSPTCVDDEEIVLSFSAGCDDCVSNPPVASISGGGAYCSPPDDGVDVIFTMEGNAPFTVTYAVDGVEDSFTSFSNTYTITGLAMGFGPSEYALVSCSDATCAETPAGGSVTVSAISEPWSVSLTTDEDSICPGEVANLTLNIFSFFGYAGLYDMTLYLDGVEQSTFINVDTWLDVPVTEIGLYQFTGTSENDCYTVSADITIYPSLGPQAELSGTADLCFGNSVDVYCELTGEGPFNITLAQDGLAYDTYVFGSPGNYLLPVFDPGVYTITSIDDGVCPGESMGEFTVIDITPSVELTGGGSICDGNEVELLFEFEGEGPWDFVYSIDGIDQSSINVLASPYSLMTATSGLYELVQGNDNQCEATLEGSADVLVSATPTATLAGDIVICAGSAGDLNLDLTGTGPWNVEYTLNGTSFSSEVMTPSSGFFNVTDAGSYILVSVSDQNCPGNVSGSAEVQVVALPTASLSGGQTICEGGTVNLTVNLTGNGNIDYQLLLDGSLFQNLDEAAGSYLIPVQDDGTYTLGTVNDDYCMEMGQGTSVVEFYPEPAITLNELTAPVCYGDEFSLSGSASGGFGGPYTYQWVSNGDTLNAASITSSAWNTGSYEFLVNDGCILSYSEITTVNVNPYPEIDASGVTYDLCGPNAITLDTQVPLSQIGETCYWTVNGQVYEGCEALQLILTQLGSYDIGLYVETLEGCITDSLLEGLVNVDPVPLADFYYTPGDPTIITDLISFHNESLGEGNSYEWMLDSVLFSNEKNPVLDLPDMESSSSWLVCLAMENEFGCRDTLCKTLSISSELILFMPSAFTPDNDGVNDLFFPTIIGAERAEYSFAIFNRWGDLIWETRELEGKWNGQGTIAEDYFARDEVYTWKITVKKAESPVKKSYQGKVTILR